MSGLTSTGSDTVEVLKSKKAKAFLHAGRTKAVDQPLIVLGMRSTGGWPASRVTTPNVVPHSMLNPAVHSEKPTSSTRILPNHESQKVDAAYVCSDIS